MQHRDRIIIQKILSEIDIGIDMLGKEKLENFLIDEKLKRAVSMTVLNDFPFVKEQLNMILNIDAASSS